MKAILAAVNYDDLLSLTLPRNRKHFDEMLVVTAIGDGASDTIDIARANDCGWYATDAFYRNGAWFNKGMALEEGFDRLGRDGWIIVMDADIVLPPLLPVVKPQCGCLYSPYRRMCRNPELWDGSLNWEKYPLAKDREFAGYFQLFHADDPVLQRRPWYASWFTACCDSDFQAKWPESQKIRPPFEVLHLGPDGQNWCGRTTPMLNGNAALDADKHKQQFAEMQKLRREHRGWGHERMSESTPITQDEINTWQ